MYSLRAELMVCAKTLPENAIQTSNEKPRAAHNASRQTARKCVQTFIGRSTKTKQKLCRRIPALCCPQPEGGKVSQKARFIYIRSHPSRAAEPGGEHRNPFYTSL
jgi:hypothetical protein